MPNIPQVIADAGGIAVVVFLVACIVYLILRIVQTVKSGGSGKNGGARPRCLESPVIGQLCATQTAYAASADHIREAQVEIAQSIALQTQLLERLASSQEKMCDLLTRMSARDEVRASAAAAGRR